MRSTIAAIGVPCSLEKATFNGLVSGKIYRKAPYLIGKSLVSYRFSLEPIH
jgi:hypothetical protein